MISVRDLFVYERQKTSNAANFNRSKATLSVGVKQGILIISI